MTDTPDESIDVLIVDDNPSIRMLAMAQLQAHGLSCAGCADGAEMWRFLEGGPVPVVLLDVMMPGEDGFSLAEQLRRRFGLAIAIIMVTGCDGSGDKAIGIGAGADDYLTKPVDWRQLVTIAERHVSSARQRRMPACQPPQPARDTCPQCASRLRLSLKSATGAVATCDACGWQSYLAC